MQPTVILTALLWLSLYVLSKAGFIGMALLIQGRMPRLIEQAEERYLRRPGRLVIVLGLINGTTIPFISILLIGTEVLALPGLVLLLFYLWLALLSYTVVYRATASRVLELDDSNSHAKQTLFGGLAAEAAFCTPLLGQAYSILLFIRGLGAITAVLLSRMVKD